MSLDLLRSLVEVGRRGAITGAAEALGLTQPALTRRIQQLEEEFGAPLVDRGRRGARLTELGRFVEREGRALLARYGRLKEEVGERVRLEAGSVRVGGGATAVSSLLPGVIRTFRAKHPGIVFELKEAGSRDVARAVARDDLELGIVTAPVRDTDLETAPLVRDRIVLVAAASHPLAPRRRITAEALQDAPLIGFEAGTAIRGLIDRALEAHGVRMNVVMELRSIQSILEMVGLDLGLAFVSRLGIAREDPRIRVVSVTGLRIERRLLVVTRRGRALSAAAAAFRDHLRTHV